MATDKTHVGLVSENRHDFVGFLSVFPYRHKPTQIFLKPDTVSAFCRLFVGFLSVWGTIFQLNKAQF